MTVQKNLSARVKKAKNSKIEMESREVAIVSGSKSDYSVRVQRNGSEMAFTCVEETGEYCRGNSFSTVCYHSFKMVIELAESKGYKIAFCANEIHARLRARIGGKAYKLTNGRRTGDVWVVVETSGPKLESWQVAQLRHLDDAIEVQEQIVLEKGWSLLAKKALAGLYESRARFTS